MLIPPEHHKVLAILHGARTMGWTISVDINLRPYLVRDLAPYVAASKEVIALADWALQSAGAAERVATTLSLALKAVALNCARQGCQPPRWAEIEAA